MSTISIQAGIKPRPRFELGDQTETTSQNGLEDAEGQRTNKHHRPSYMPTRGLAAVLNQGLATLGSKLGKFIVKKS